MFPETVRGINTEVKNRPSAHSIMKIIPQLTRQWLKNRFWRKKQTFPAFFPFKSPVTANAFLLHFWGIKNLASIEL
jgi:hypothetical protein